jgi:hypothetical protein
VKSKNTMVHITHWESNLPSMKCGTIKTGVMKLKNLKQLCKLL